MSKRAVWELEHGDGTWMRFGEALRLQVEHAFRSALKPLLHGIPCISNDLEGVGGAGYTFDWLRMIRIDTTSGERRRIRRVAAPTKYLTEDGLKRLEHYARLQADELAEQRIEPRVIYRRATAAAAKTLRGADEDDSDQDRRVDGAAEVDMQQPALRRVRLEEAHGAAPFAAAAGAAAAALGAVAAVGGLGGGGDDVPLLFGPRLNVPLDAHAGDYVRGRQRNPPVQLRVMEEDTPQGRVVYHYEMRHKSRPLFVMRQMIEATGEDGAKSYVYYSRFGTLGTVGQLNSYSSIDKKYMLSNWRTKFRAKFGTTWADVAAVGDRFKFTHASFDMLPLPAGAG